MSFVSHVSRVPAETPVPQSLVNAATWNRVGWVGFACFAQSADPRRAAGIRGDVAVGQVDFPFLWFMYGCAAREPDLPVY